MAGIVFILFCFVKFSSFLFFFFYIFLWFLFLFLLCIFIFAILQIGGRGIPQLPGSLGTRFLRVILQTTYGKKLITQPF